VWSGPGLSLLTWMSHRPTRSRCLERAAELVVLAALDDRARTGREAQCLHRKLRLGLSRLPARSRSRLGIHTNCGRPACWLRMHGITGRRPVIRACRNGLRGRCARAIYTRLKYNIADFRLRRAAPPEILTHSSAIQRFWIGDPRIEWNFEVRCSLAAKVLFGTPIDGRFPSLTLAIGLGLSCQKPGMMLLPDSCA
jgi:hypothetical protein